MMKRLLALLCCLLLAAPALAEETPPLPVMQVHQMNLGFADGYLIRCGDIDIMIDGGNANPQKPTDDVMNYLAAAGVETLDAYIITHWHLDHCMNLNKVLAVHGDENTVVYGPSAKEHPDYRPLANGAYRQMQPGDVIRMGGMTFHCMGPKSLENNGSRNQDSLNFVLEYGQQRILFTGDFTASGHVLGQYKDLCQSVDVLKFPHHGMKPYEIGNRAIQTVYPTYVLVPGVVNKNEIWNYLVHLDVRLPRENILTVGDGNVMLMMDGETIQIRTQVTLAELGAL